MTSAADAVRADYLARRDACAREHDALARRCRWLSHARLVVFAAFALAAWLAFGPRTIDAALPLVPLGAFAALAFAHDRALRARDEAARAAAHYERGLARLEHRFAGTGSAGEAHRPARHDYAEDLDLFGEGSLFELLSTARTSTGEATLARWLCAPAAPAEVRARQGAVAALRARVDLREALARLPDDVPSRVGSEALAAWAERDAAAPSVRARAALAALAVLALCALAAWPLGAGPAPLAGAIALEVVAALGVRARARRAVDGLDGAVRALGLLDQVIACFESEPFDRGADERLRALHRALAGDAHSAAREIARLKRLAELRDAMRNQLFAPLGALLLWGPQLALAIAAWRARCGHRVRDWLAAAGELEALVSLAGHAHEHPDDAFPELRDDVGPLFDARGLGHPLIADAHCVRNDLRLSTDAPIRIVSGSNMSGKSTLLRAVGVAAAMAQAGAPVRAKSLALSPLSVVASLRIVDSLQRGTSHFYAELERLRRVVDVASDAALPPALFLLDEVLHGTNSHDRRIGARAIVATLLERGALGLATTHDLALAEIARELAPRIANVHFEDRLEDGRLVFDYRLREGVVERSNALDLMRAVGLDVG